MCGIVGYMSFTTPAREDTVRKMAASIAHRGPDADGVWIDPDAHIAFGHRRLSIVDLSEAGRQPMISANGQLVLVFNGEIYNHRELRQEIDATGWSMGWRGHSDTETLLAALQIWGIAETLPRLNGMFAFALWDRESRILRLARDRTGEKPLYFGHVGKTILFGSELKALSTHPEWHAEIDRNVLAAYFRHGYVPDPHCIYKDFYKLPPAHWLEIAGGHISEPVSYWDLADAATAPRRTENSDLLLNELEVLLRSAVGLRMEADVPLGAFLSGGIDSSLVVALMQAQSTNPVKTFTIGFDVPGYNEAEHAKAIATHLGTDHTELYLSPQDALDVVPQLPHLWDEPFADSSQIPTLLLSRMTRENVTVSLSGDGGDELFCGYNRYGQGFDLHRRLRRLPNPAQRMLSTLLSNAPAHTIDVMMQAMPKRFRYPALGDRLRKLGNVLSHAEGNAYYRSLISQFQTPADLITGATEVNTLLNQPDQWPDLEDYRELMMYLDTLTYLPGDILTKVDRASMAVSLEARVPLLDHRVIEFAWSLPFDMKINARQMKWALRQILARHVPHGLFERPKMGFGVPIEHWLSGPLRDWAEQLLSKDTLASDGYLNVEQIQKMWTEHKSGHRRWHHQLWTVLMFQAWLQR